MSISFRTLLFSLLLVLSLPLRAEQPPVVVASIKPLHSLLSGVMAGIAEPKLLIESGTPHHFSLRPSDRRLLAQADLLIWFGSWVEGSLGRVIESLPPEVERLALLDQAGAPLLHQRQGGLWGDGHHHHGSDHEDDESGWDGHLWLDPLRAQWLVEQLVEQLVRLDPAHTEEYRYNGEQLEARLLALDRQLQQRLLGVRGRGYLVYHDAYHYFEQRYRLDGRGAFTVDAEMRPGIRRIQQLRGEVEQAGVRCLFIEPQYDHRLVTGAFGDLPLRVATLDPLGAELKAGSELYFQLLEALAATLTECLSREQG